MEQMCFSWHSNPHMLCHQSLIHLTRFPALTDIKHLYISLITWKIFKYIARSQNKLQDFMYLLCCLKCKLLCEAEKKIQSTFCFREVYSAASLWVKDFNSTVTFKPVLTVALLFSLNNSPFGAEASHQCQPWWSDWFWWAPPIPAWLTLRPLRYI